MLRVNLAQLFRGLQLTIWSPGALFTVRNVTGFVLGAVTFVATHSVEVAMWTQWFGGVHSPWFLNSGQAGRFTMEWMFIVSFVAGLFRTPAGPIAAGACVAMTVTMFRLPDGPGSIFPIVIVVGSGFLLMGVLTGTFAAWVIREGWAKLHGSRR